MARNKFSSPTLDLRITPEQYEDAIKGSSGGCLLADAIKKQYPQLTGITVDMATIRVTDRKAGMRYTYLAPPSAQHVLLSYDQGWPQPTDRVLLKRAVKVTPIVSGGRRKMAAREERLAELEAMAAADEPMTSAEKAALTKLRKPPRPKTQGPSEVHVDNRGAVVHGRAPKQGKAHPNLLRGRDRHFGAKLAKPGVAFNAAVEARVRERLEEEERRR